MFPAPAVPSDNRIRIGLVRWGISLLSYISEIIDKMLKCGFQVYSNIFPSVLLKVVVRGRGWGRKGLKGAEGWEPTSIIIIRRLVQITKLAPPSSSSQLEYRKCGENDRTLVPYDISSL